MGRRVEIEMEKKKKRKTCFDCGKYDSSKLVTFTSLLFQLRATIWEIYRSTNDRFEPCAGGLGPGRRFIVQ